MTTEEKLIERAKLLAERAEKINYRESLRKQILAKVQAELDAVDQEIPMNGIDDRIKVLEDEITQEVLQAGATVKVAGAGMCVYNKGRISWNTEGLDGLMVAVPQLAQFRKMGKPYVAFK